MRRIRYPKFWNFWHSMTAVPLFLLQGNGRRNIRNWRNGFWNRDVMWDFWDMNAMI